MTELKAIIQRLACKLRIFSTNIYFTVFPKAKNSVIDNFHQIYYDSGVMGKTWAQGKFLGVPIQKCPFDIMVYQEILFDLKPDLIIECGTAYGGTAYFMACMCDIIGKGEVLTIDIADHGNLPKHTRIKYLLGSSTSPDVLEKVKNAVDGKNTVLVILDSDHSKSHVLKELESYPSFVTVGSYIIIEDSNVNGHPVYKEHGDGPMEALTDFMGSTSDFEIDRDREKHLVTFNPSGYLKRIK